MARAQPRCRAHPCQHPVGTRVEGLLPPDTQRAQPAAAGVLQVRAVWRNFRGHPGCALQAQPGPTAQVYRPVHGTPGPATVRYRRRLAPGSMLGRLTPKTPRPGPALGPVAHRRPIFGSPRGEYTANGEYRPTVPRTARNPAVQHPGRRAARCTAGRSSSLAKTASGSPTAAPNASAKA